MNAIEMILRCGAHQPPEITAEHPVVSRDEPISTPFLAMAPGEGVIEGHVQLDPVVAW